MNQTQNRTSVTEYFAAFNSARFAKNICLAAIIVAILLELACFCLVRYAGVIDAVAAPDVEEVVRADTPKAKIAKAKIPFTSSDTKPVIKSATSPST